MLPGSGSDLPPFGTGIGSGSGSNPPGPRPRFPFGTSFENAVLSFAAERNPDTEHYIVVDLSRGFIRTTVNEAREYAELGHAVFDLAGWRPVWDPPLEITRKSREEVNDAFHDQYTEIWDLEDQAQAMNDAHLDEEIFYDTNDKKFKRRKVVIVKSPHSKKGGDNDDKRDPSAGAGSGATGSSAVTT